MLTAVISLVTMALSSCWQVSLVLAYEQVGHIIIDKTDTVIIIIINACLQFSSKIFTIVLSLNYQLEHT